jgi:predicted polyphosphate/ATP-dependent NAD kinase
VDVRPAGPAEAVVGFVVNPRSGHDIRRLVARASVFPNTEKVMMLQRVLGALGATGVDRVVAVVDSGAIIGALARAVEGHRPELDGPWPTVDLLELELTGRAEDSVTATRALVALGVRAVLVLGGDGTDRQVATVCGSVPLVPLSTGTNNAFAHLGEATVAGLAAGLVASGRLPVHEACRRDKVLIVEHRDRRELALVDVAVTASSSVGARALWHPEELRELFVTFAEPTAIGLSSVAALLQPVSRDDDHGLWLDLGAPGTWEVMAPVAPGLVRGVPVRAVEPLLAGRPRVVQVTDGVLALDGERELELRGDPATITLSLDGPWSLDVARVMELAAERRLLARPV